MSMSGCRYSVAILLAAVTVSGVGIGCGETSNASDGDRQAETSDGCEYNVDCPDGESCVYRQNETDKPGECSSLLRCECPDDEVAYCQNDVQQPCVVPTTSCHSQGCPDGYSCNEVSNVGNCICSAGQNEECALHCESDADCGVDNGFSCEDGRCVK